MQTAECVSSTTYHQSMSMAGAGIVLAGPAAFGVSGLSWMINLWATCWYCCLRSTYACFVMHAEGVHVAWQGVS
jgi:hypothetical protein